jgi:hypothetical protein
MPHTDGVFCRPPEIDAKDGTEEKKNLVAICSNLSFPLLPRRWSNKAPCSTRPEKRRLRLAFVLIAGV